MSWSAVTAGVAVSQDEVDKDVDQEEAILGCWRDFHSLGCGVTEAVVSSQLEHSERFCCQDN